MQDAIVHQSVAKYCQEIKACGTVMGKGDKPNVPECHFTARRHNKTNQEKKNKRTNEKIFDKVSKRGNSRLPLPFMYDRS